jgi:hypothetical protein
MLAGAVPASAGFASAGAGFPRAAGAVEAGAAERSAGGRFCRHSRNTKNRQTAAMGTRIHGQGDPLFSVSLIVLPTSNRLAAYFHGR